MATYEVNGKQLTETQWTDYINAVKAMIGSAKNAKQPTYVSLVNGQIVSSTTAPASGDLLYVH